MREIEKNNYLAKYAKAVTSQDGEDGVLAEIFTRMGLTHGWCVEFGAWDGKLHSNTWDLIHNKQWKAVYIEPVSEVFRRLEQNCQGLSDIHCFNQLVEIDGINSLDAILGRTPIPPDFELLVIDIDGNDFYVWRSLERYRPKVVMIEFNPFIPADINFAKWNDGQVKASASLKAVCELGKTKGYELVCTIGPNAVFVPLEYFPRFEIEDNRPEAMFRALLDTKLFQGYDGTLFLAGNRKIIWRHQIDRAGILEHVEVADDDIQALPRALRVFRPRMSYQNDFLEQQAAAGDSANQTGNILFAFRANVTSECGEDGILRRIFELIGTDNKYCVEVGAYDGRTFSNTWSLLNEQTWSGVLIEKNDEAFKALTARYAGSPLVQLVQAEVTTTPPVSLDAILTPSACPQRFDFLCVDVEGNDYSLWASLRQFRPRVVMIDFNPTISNEVIFAQQDDPSINDGASLRALIQLAQFKGYELAAVTSWNAIFVDRESFPRLGQKTEEIDAVYAPVLETRVFQSIDSYFSMMGCDRLIRHNYVFDENHLQPLAPNVRVLPFVTGNLGELRSTFFDRVRRPDDPA